MSKLLMLQGLPASGKSTRARELVDKGWVRVNKDDLRAMMHNSKHTKGNESQAIAVRDLIVLDALERNRNVVVDDTNFNPIHEARLRELVDLSDNANVQFEKQSLDTPLEICIERDLKRPNSVGEKVIRQMYNQYLLPQQPSEVQWQPTLGLPECILVDIDGTIANMHKGEPGRRGPYEWHRVGEDSPEYDIIQLVRLLYAQNDCKIILLSGRNAICRPETEEWLARHNVPYHELFMRDESDNRRDYLTKRDLFDTHINGVYNVRFILDDRDQVVNMWRAMGLRCLQVAPGEF